jgi:FkbM family methyltransferase
MRWVVGSGVHGYWLGSYEAVTRSELRSLLRPGAVFFDVGAHVGFYTLMASRVVGHGGLVVAFEPNPRNLAFLHRHVGMNAIRNVRVIDAAASSTLGRLRFSCTDTESSMGHVSDVGTIEVAATTLDHAVFATGVRAPDVIKIDVEGHEAPVLEGATRILDRFGPAVLLEVGEENRAGCDKILLRHGYSSRPIVRSGRGTGHLLFLRARRPNRGERSEEPHPSEHPSQGTSDRNTTPGPLQDR